MMRPARAAGLICPPPLVITCIALATPMLFANLGASAFAAVRLCQEEVASGLVSAGTEAQARKAALDAWKEKVRKFGEGYTSWRLASPKFLKCLPGKGGAYECLARGAPCMIEQAPSRRHLREKRLGI